MSSQKGKIKEGTMEKLGIALLLDCIAIGLGLK